MNIIFIRHGQGEHTLNFPESLQIVDPCLTEKGKVQSKRLSERFLLTADDMMIISPTRRTIQTAKHWDHPCNSQHIIHNAVGPRMFPLLPTSRALLCDTPLPKEEYSPS
jgi:broad specificity phosphatase PhoE